MNWPRALAFLSAALAFAGLLALADPWAAPAGPTLIVVTGLSPSDVEPGDRIAIAGGGFPAGEEARVRFRGTLHRPGERPITGAEVTVAGMASGPDEVDVDFGETTQALFCGAADRAVHTTFEGEVEVAFAAAAPGAAPVAGLLRQAVLDVRPSASAADRAREADGERSAAFLGLRLDPPARRGLGLTVDAVQPGSPADAAGIVPGDAITSFDGVRVTAVDDLVPGPGVRQAMLGVRSSGAISETSRPIAVDGFRRGPPAELRQAALVIVAALVLALLAGGAVPGAVATALQRASIRLRAAGSAREIFGRAAREVLPPASAWAAVDALGVAVFAVMPFGQYLVAARLDVAILFFAAVAVLAGAAVVAGSGLRAAAHVAWQHLPAGLAVASVVVATGSLRVQEIARAQGALPWEWLAFRSPSALLAFVLLLACTRVSPAGGSTGRTALEAFVDPADRSAMQGRMPGGLAAAVRGHRFLVSGVAATLFLGGWSLPGLSPAQQDGRLGLELAGGVWLVAKAGLVAVIVALLQQAAPAPALLDGSRVATRRWLPLAIVALATTAAWERWSPEGSAQPPVSAVLLAVATLATVNTVRRLRHGMFSAGADGHLSPFL